MSSQTEMALEQAAPDAGLLSRMFATADRIMVKKLRNNDRDWAHNHSKHQAGVFNSCGNTGQRVLSGADSQEAQTGRCCRRQLLQICYRSPFLLWDARKNAMVGDMNA